MRRFLIPVDLLGLKLDIVIGINEFFGDYEKMEKKIMI